MKIIAQYDVDNAQDREACMRMMKSLDLCLVLFEYQEHLHNLRDRQSITSISVEEAQKTLFELLERRNVNLDELLS